LTSGLANTTNFRHKSVENATEIRKTRRNTLNTASWRIRRY